MSGQTIAQRLHDEILNGDLAPGTRLRQEEIAERFGSSRLPVRDALRRLEADGPGNYRLQQWCLGEQAQLPRVQRRL